MIKEILTGLVCLGVGFFLGVGLLSNGFDRDKLDRNPIGFWTEHNTTDSYMCVWLDFQTRKQIQDTYNHEFVHEIIENDEYHFLYE
jgi:hypothetical protein